MQTLQPGSGISKFRLTKKQQEGGFLALLLASIGIPLIMKTLNGKGLHAKPHLPSNTRNIYVTRTVSGAGGKANKKRTTKAKGLLLG